MRNKDRDEYEAEGTPCGTGCCGVLRKRECDGYVNGHCGSYTCSVCYGPGEDHSFCKNEEEEKTVEEHGGDESEVSAEELLDIIDRLKDKTGTAGSAAEELYSMYKETVGPLRPLPFRDAWQVLANAAAFAEVQTGTPHSAVIVPEHKEGDVLGTLQIMLLHDGSNRETIERVIRTAGRKLVQEQAREYGYGVSIRCIFFGVSHSEEVLKREMTLLVCVKEDELALFAIDNGVATYIPPHKKSIPLWTLFLALTEEAATEKETAEMDEAVAYTAETMQMYETARAHGAVTAAEA